MRSFSLLFFFSILLILSSCKVSSTLSQYETRLNRQAETQSISPALVNKPILASLTIGESRVSSIFETTSKEINNGSFSTTPVGMQLSSLKAEAEKRSQFAFLDEYQCDYIIDPIYETSLSIDENTKIVSIKVTLMAYPATFDNFSQPDSLPKSVFQLSQVDGREVPLMIESRTLTYKNTKIDKGWILGGSFGTSFKRDENLNQKPSSGIGTDLRYFMKFNFNEAIALRWELGASLRQAGYFFDKMSDDEKLEYYYQFFRYPIEGKATVSRVNIEIPLALNVRPNNWIELYAGPAIMLGIMELNNASYSYSLFPDGGSDGSIDEGVSTSEEYDFNFGMGIMSGVSILGNNDFGFSLRWQLGFGDDGMSGLTAGLILPIK